MIFHWELDFCVWKLNVFNINLYGKLHFKKVCNKSFLINKTVSSSSDSTTFFVCKDCSAPFHIMKQAPSVVTQVRDELSMCCFHQWCVIQKSYFFDQHCLWDSKEQQGPLRLFLSLHIGKEHSCHQYSLLCCGKLNTLSFLQLNMPFYIGDVFYPGWYFCKVDFLKYKAARMALHFHTRGFSFSVLPI